MKEYINKNKLIDYIGECIARNADFTVSDLLKIIKAYPHTPMNEIIGNRLKDGQWLERSNKCVCIICGEESDKKTEFCPNCGAKNY